MSIIGTDNWPKKWAQGPAAITTSGLGQAENVNQSLHILPCEGPEGQKGSTQPYIIDIPINLWGRQWEAYMMIPPLTKETDANPPFS